MERFTEYELAEAERAIASALGKSEKVLTKLRPGTPQHGLTERGIEAYRIAFSLIEQERGGTRTLCPKEQLERARETMASFVVRVERVLPKFAPGTSQHTLAMRRIAAFELAGTLIEQTLDERSAAD